MQQHATASHYAGWRSLYESHTVSAEEAVAVIRSGQRVGFSYGREPLELGMALMARAHELEDIKIYIGVPGRDFGWYEAWGHPFAIEYEMKTPVAASAVEAHRLDQSVSSIYGASERTRGAGEFDVYFIELSPPDSNGFCSFGASVWDKLERVQGSGVVIASVNPNTIRTYGENHVHASNIDYFVPHEPTGAEPAAADLLGRKPGAFDPVALAIAEYVGEIIKDGDTLQIGVGTSSEPLAQSSVLRDKHDLGWHSEATPKGIIRLIMDGVITGARKTHLKGKAVATSIGGGNKEEMSFVNGNPMFELYPNKYCADPRIIAAHDNMVAINNGLAVDLTGQVTAESIGHYQISTAGGQTPFAYGALLSSGGRNVVVLPSTTGSGKVSRIVAAFEPGTIVTQTRPLADHIVTEYGIARLRGKTVRERARELIAIAHPDFRASLEEQAKKLYWP